MSAMSELHAEIAEIAVNDTSLVRCFHDDQASYRWGLLSAANVMMTASQHMSGEALEAVLFAHNAILAAHDCAQPEG